MGSNSRHVVHVYVGSLSSLYEALTVEASKQTTAEEIIECLVEKLNLESPDDFELTEVVSSPDGKECCKERKLGKHENPVAVQVLWPKPNSPSEKGHSPEFQVPEYRFYLRHRGADGKGNTWLEGTDPQLIRDYFLRYLYQPRDKEYADLCQLPDLNEATLLDNLRTRFKNGDIYTYVGSILIAVNPFQFYPIYNPKYVKLYQNRRLGELPPHIFAIADAAYHTMLSERTNQCIVISGESGSGKTESTNLLLHHLTALSQKGTHGSGVEQTILSAGPVLEAFGNAKTAHNNNSSRFGKFIQVNYRENGMVHGAMVQKYLLEKSRIVSHAKNERNYHVFYYLLAGASIAEREMYKLQEPKDYRYLNQSSSFVVEGVDEAYEFLRLKQSMEMVGFSPEKQKRLFSVLSAVLYLGNVEFVKKKTYHHHEAVNIKNPEIVSLISSLLKVKEETLTSALTSKKAKACGETLIINYKLPEAIATRDALAKCLYGALFDWIVMQVNHALLSKKDSLDHQGNAIGVLDIFGFEDFGFQNSFEQFCINFANEHLQYYFNQHVFRYEQEEYRREGIRWTNIEFIDNTGCLNLIGGRPNGLFCLLDDQCSFPGATNETLLQKYENSHKENEWYEVPQKRENAFSIKHYAGKVKYQIKDFREKNLDLMRTDIVSVLKNSRMSFVRELVGVDPVAVFRWAIVRAFFRGYHAFQQAGKTYRNREGGGDRGLKKTVAVKSKRQNSNENIFSNCSQKHQKQNSPFMKNELKPNNVNACNDAARISVGLSSPLHGIENLCSTEAIVFHRANKILMKNRSFKPKVKNDKTLKNLQSVKTLACRTQSIGSTRTRKHPQTVTAQFQYSLSQLMVTLNHASPFFVRCIKSNGEKVSNLFDDELVQRQLRYTGMLETVRIRQAGYNVRLTFEEFIQNYRILLLKGLLSSRNDITEFLERMELDKENYQMGKEKVFLRESEKLKLDEHLHQAILERIVRIQRWMRASFDRRSFLNLRHAIITIQAGFRGFLARRTVQQMKMQMFAAAVCIQKFWRGYRVRKQFDRLRKGITFVQRMCRGQRARVQFQDMKEKKRKETLLQLKEYGDTHSAHSDEAFMSKDSSQEELRSERSRFMYNRQISRDSEESSGIQDDSEIENLDSGSHGHKRYLHTSSGSISSGLSPGSPVSLSNVDQHIVDKQHQKENTRYISHSGARPSWPNENSHSPDKFRNIESSLNGKYKWNYRMSELVKPSFTLHEEKSIKTNLTIKRSRSAKASLQELSSDTTEELSLSKESINQNSISQQIEIVKDKSFEDLKSSDISSPTKSGAFYKARKHFRTFIGGTKKEKRGTITDESDESGCEEVSLCPSETLPNIPFSSIDGSFIDRQDSGELALNSHTFKPSKSFSKWEDCAYCQKSMSFFNQGYKCSVCKLMFHPKCSQQSHRLSCCYTSDYRSPRAPRKRKPSKGSEMKVAGKWNVTRTSEFTDSKDKIISDVTELQRLDAFIFKKISEMNESGGRRDTIVDVIFKRALKEFKANLISTYSVAASDGKICVRYKDLIDNFEQVMGSVCKQENTSAGFPSTMGLNAFRGFLDQFMNSLRADEKPKAKMKKEKRKKNEQAVEYQGHEFIPVVVNIPTTCESCSYFIWLMEKALVCQACKMICHKKCCCKITNYCKETQNGVEQDGNKVFGVSLQYLVTEDFKIPVVVERLITTIEMKGLYTEGIYRKSGSSTKVKALKQALEEDWELVNFDLYAVHVLTTTLKSFFREMPQPLMTFECYDSFLRATDISDSNERIQTLFSVMDSIPKQNYDLLERLIFHLARVAQHEESNRMSPNALSIVFAPCILRTNKNMRAQDSLNDIAKQTMCVDYIIKEQLKKVNKTLAEIDTLDTACHTASNRLSSIRSSKVGEGNNNISITTSEDEEETILTQHIETLKHEKAHLTTVLPALELKRASSDDDMLSTDVDSNIGSVDDVSGYEEYAVTFDLPVSPPACLEHLTKKRASAIPQRRLPSKFSRAYDYVRFGENDRGEVKRNSSYHDDSIVSMYHQPATSLYEEDAIMV